MNRLGIYLRVSLDQTGEAAAVARQDQDCTALAERRGVAVERYEDNDTSAYKRSVVRPDFERMLTDLESGAISGIIAYDLDRLWRQPRDLERVIEIYERRPGLTFLTVSNDIDLSSSDGQMLARVMVAAANKSSKDTARRVARKHQEIQESGRPGGGPRPFGFLADRVTHHPVEATAIVTAVERIMAGASISEICREWDREGFRTTRGGEWRPTSMRQLLRNPRLKGERWKRTDWSTWTPVVDAAGNPVKAVWDPILTPARFDALADFLDGRTVSQARSGRKGVVKYLLTGIVRCGLCGAKMHGARSSHENGQFLYKCPPETLGGCGRINRQGPAIDAFVTAVVLTALRQDAEGTETVEHEVDVQPDLDRIARQLDAIKNRWRAGRLDDEDYFALRDELSDDRKALQAEQRSAATERSRREAEVDVESKWEGLSLPERRALIENRVSAVVVKPRPDRRVRFDPRLIEVTWRRSRAA